jgi:hypothetical protein
MNQHLYHDRRKEFHEKLVALIGEYPELAVDPLEDEYEGFDPESPRMLQGHVLVLSYENLDGYGQLLWSAPFDQNYYQTLGMLAKAADIM